MTQPWIEREREELLAALIDERFGAAKKEGEKLRKQSR
jgi:hypothetical protein